MGIIGGLFLFGTVEVNVSLHFRYPQGRLGQMAVDHRCHVSMRRFPRGESLWSTVDEDPCWPRKHCKILSKSGFQSLVHLI
ncbi:hypothetical protein SORBI_3004G231001 [Sorghum bicolor]|uniref:Uncharacterized protein n=1 Tax=Sorghum bicolor TaxID=4558 RepID=A0A1Z5RP70_SORBI|nr:hypothetical protein SORBI_3004G231001 [Sorghum bicolor]